MTTTKCVPHAIILDGVIYRLQSGPSARAARTVRRGKHTYAFEVSPQAENTAAATLLRKILNAAGIEFAQPQLYLTPSEAKWEGKARFGLEVKIDAKGQSYLIVRAPHRGPYFGGFPVKDEAEAIKLMRDLKKEV
jgi:hypothetical protein